ncbi:MAG TPA: hypothetical protein VGU45_01245 [Microvirga sp.]|nr:hypothetical protein [Microvirga sp.]
MIPARLLALLIQPMLALLLLAGVPALEPDRQGHRVQGVERILALATAAHEDAGEWRSDRSAETERFEGDAPPKGILTAFAPLRLDLALAIAVGCAFDATAPPRHRACAAPPTGPPSSDA